MKESFKTSERDDIPKGAYFGTPETAVMYKDMYSSDQTVLVLDLSFTCSHNMYICI